MIARCTTTFITGATRLGCAAGNKPRGNGQLPHTLANLNMRDVVVCNALKLPGFAD